MSTPAKIMLVDDDPALLMAVGDQLKMEGYEVTRAESGESALQLLRTFAPDLIILDISMPGMSGLAFLKKISGPDAQPRYPILIFTARANMERFFSETAVDSFLAKTSDPSRLVEEVNRILISRKPKAARIESEHQHRCRVLIVEDEPKLSARLSSCFSAAGYAALSLLNPAELMETIQTTRPDVILIKEILPSMKGSSIAAQLASFTHASGISVILYDNSGIHKADTRFPNVARFVTSNAPPDLLKAVAAVTG
jgi:DNA-binding response OmpR family regulator